MSLFNKKSSSDLDNQHSGNAGKNKLSLLILLVLAGVFAYLYFFTSLIVPHEAAAPKPPEAKPEVKQSMPPRPAESGSTTAAVADAKKTEAVKPAPAAVPAAPAAAKPAVPAVPATPAAAKPAVPAPAPAAAKPVPAPQPATRKAPAPAAPAAATTKKEAAKPAKAAAKTDPSKTAAPPKPVKKSVAYTISTGELPAGADVDAAEAKLKKHGIKPVLKQVAKKGRVMNRLFVNAYSDYDAYSTGLETAKKSSSAAFGIEKDGKYYIYAGSFSSAALAQKEKVLLQGKGLKVNIQKTVLPGTTLKVTAGSFATKAAASKAAATLAKDGLAVRVIPKGK